MTFAERLAEIERIKTDNREILATPLMSEGNISPDQVGMFSKRQGEKWLNNAMERMRLESLIKQLSKTDDELRVIVQDEQDKEANNRITQIIARIRDINSWGRMTHRENGKLKPKWQREIDTLNEELNLINMAK